MKIRNILIALTVGGLLGGLPGACADSEKVYSSSILDPATTTLSSLEFATFSRGSSLFQLRDHSGNAAPAEAKAEEGPAAPAEANSEKVYSSSILDPATTTSSYSEFVTFSRGSSLFQLRERSGNAAPAEAKAEEAPAAPAAPAASAVKPPPKEVSAFLDRVFKNIPASAPASFTFKSWPYTGKPTEEGVGMMPVSGLDPEAVVKRVMDVDHYVGNIGHVKACKSKKDARFSPPQSVRFYQHLDLSLLGDIHHELVLVDGGMRQGYRVLYWYMLAPETNALSRDGGMRSAYNVGAWLISKDAVGYALSSAPQKDDTNFIQWQSLTNGADVAAKGVVEDNIKGMVAWSKQ